MKTKKQKLQDNLGIYGYKNQIHKDKIKHHLKALKDDLKEEIKYKICFGFSSDRTRCLKILDQKFTEHIGEDLLNSSKTKLAKGISLKDGVHYRDKTANTEPEVCSSKKQCRTVSVSSGSPKSKDEICECGIHKSEHDRHWKNGDNFPCKKFKQPKGCEPKTSKGCGNVIMKGIKRVECGSDEGGLCDKCQYPKGHEGGGS